MQIMSGGLRLATNGKDLPRVAYFCMEYGLSDRLPIYAGGLGVLAGDYIKAARDLNLPVVGVGIIWKQDYTHQFIGNDLRPYDVFPNIDYKFLEDTGVKVAVRIQGENVLCKVRFARQFGNMPLYLLDTNFPGSTHGWITRRLYSSKLRDRVAAEMVLGIGGVRALRALGIPVDVYHFNEGHAALAGVELIREKMQGQGMSFEDAWKETRKQVVFTTHTPVAAGNESFEHQLLRKMEAYNTLNYHQMKTLGGDPFNMTVAALRLSRITNAVSKTHGRTARQMWEQVIRTSPIISITNGIHINTWQDRGIREAYKNGRDLWEPHLNLKKYLINHIMEQTGTRLNENALIVGFARRAAPYKRSDLLFRNEEIIAPLLQKKKLQLVFSGKAHPDDSRGKEIIRALIKMDRKYRDSIVFLENYNMKVASLMVQGCDVWLNNPRRPMEASGTSGMKAAVNGVLNLSIVDGWVGEGIRHGVSGWTINEMEKGVSEPEQDQEDLRELYRVLTDEVIPAYYASRNKWVDMMRASIDMARWQFSSQRMALEYYDRMYRAEVLPEQETGHFLAEREIPEPIPLGGLQEEANTFTYKRNF